MSAELMKLPRKDQYQKVDRMTGGGVFNFLDVSKNARSLRYQHLPAYSDETDEQIEQKLNERFELLREGTVDCYEGRIRALIAAGPGGVGKTFAMDEELAKWDPDGTKHQAHRGYMRATGLYKQLYKCRERGSLLKLDDMDSVFKDETALQILKIACDTTQKRIITWGSEAKFEDEDTGEPLPSMFEFKGTMMFITNLDFDILIDKGNAISPHLDAMMTRSNYIDLGMKTKRDYLIRLFQVVNEGLFEQMDDPLNEEEQNDVLMFIDSNHRILRECSLRMALKIGGIRKSWTPDSKIHWTRKATLMCCVGAR